MSYQRERDLFMTQCGLPVDDARYVLRAATSLQRLAEADCNGDWPYNGDRDIMDTPSRERLYSQCPACQRLTARSAIRAHLCPICRTEANVEARFPGKVAFSGDPRGAVLRLSTARCPLLQPYGGLAVPTR